MDEVDKIIIQALRQIGCTNLDDEVNLNNFSTELIVHCVAKCLKEIKPEAKAVPATIPSGGNMAQRFAVATTLADMCAACGYRSDIGYQTFLYPNAVDVRRLFMFLIECLPKESTLALEATSGERGDSQGVREILRKVVKPKLLQQLRAPWIPQYGRAVGNWRHRGCSSQNVAFSPLLNINVPDVSDDSKCSKEVQQYMDQQQSPNMFQQLAEDEHCDLIATVLHKNAKDLHHGEGEDWSELHYCEDSLRANLQLTKSTTTSPMADKELPTAAGLTPLGQLTERVEQLKLEIEKLLICRKALTVSIDSHKQQLALLQEQELPQIRKTIKRHERTSLVLENPQENVPKLEQLVESTKAKRQTLEQQWQSYRQPMLENRQTLLDARSKSSGLDSHELNKTIAQMEQQLNEKTLQHAQLAAELKAASGKNAVAPRHEYTQRIYEFIGNIRKQRNDIFKVLDDTRDLQKQINSVSAQLQRQFNYTDDLLFHSAKHDVHAKKAYKLLAALHATCNDLIDTVVQTGNMTKEIRELEEQIDRERGKNIGESLSKISLDIQHMENAVKRVQSEIRKVENEVTVGE